MFLKVNRNQMWILKSNLSWTKLILRKLEICPDMPGMYHCATMLTWHALQQLGVAHLAFPDVSQDVLHPLGSPQEVEHPQVVAHTLASEHLADRGHINTQQHAQSPI